MKVKHFIVTYNNPYQLNAGLTSLFNSISKEERDILEVYVINNHSNFQLNEEFQSSVKVLHNVLRPDFSNGHLSRNWNQAIILGFENLRNPSCDIVITSQDDTRFAKNYIDTTIKLHEQYDMVQFGWGDNFVSYTPNAIRMVGLWDERFCSIGYQEADYFLRSYLYNTDRSSIQDYSHGRLLNVSQESPILVIPSGNSRGEVYNREATKHHEYNKNLFIKKWGINPYESWSKEMLTNVTPRMDSYMLYPYFENDVMTLEQQNFNR